MEHRKIPRRVVVRLGLTVAFWWFMVVSQQSGGTLTASTQGPFASQAQCEWGRQQIAPATGSKGFGWSSTTCWNDSP